MQMLVLLYKYIKNIKSILYYKNIGALPRVLVVLSFVLFGAIYDKKMELKCSKSLLFSF